MKLRPLYPALAFALCWTAFCSTLILPAQTTSRKPFQPAAQQAPGAAPNKVWLNASTKVYHCPGDRYYGRTKAGKYMTELEAKATGAHGPRGETCFK
jgi:hypothetical protein